MKPLILMLVSFVGCSVLVNQWHEYSLYQFQLQGSKISRLNMRTGEVCIIFYNSNYDEPNGRPVFSWTPWYCTSSPPDYSPLFTESGQNK